LTGSATNSISRKTVFYGLRLLGIHVEIMSYKQREIFHTQICPLSFSDVRMQASRPSFDPGNTKSCA